MTAAPLSAPVGVEAGSRAGLWLAAGTACALVVIALLPFDQEPDVYWSDAITGLLVLALCGWWHATARAWPRWMTAVLGIWLLLAPLVWWATHAWSALVDLVAGTLLITAAAILPTVRTSDAGGGIPWAWSYNPSEWSQRWPIMGLALAGFVMSAHLAAVQLGYLDQAWDPLFGNGTQRVLTSDISHWFPVSDAGLGAVSYLIEALTCLVGDRNRWRTMPWMVLIFGVLIIPTGAVSIVLVVLQPIGVGSWCLLCLTTAAVMLLMVAPALDEVVATWQALRRSRQRYGRWARMLWSGAGAETVAAMTNPAPAPRTTTPWLLLVASVLAAGLLGAPYVVGTAGTVAGASDHLAGAVAVTAAVIASSTIARPVRWVLVPVGLWLLGAAWALPGATSWSITANGITGVVLLLAAWRSGVPRQRARV